VALALLEVFELIEQVARRLASQSGVITIRTRFALIAMAGGTRAGSFRHVVFEVFSLAPRHPTEENADHDSQPSKLSGFLRKL